eukprot:sb/3473245/
MFRHIIANLAKRTAQETATASTNTPPCVPLSTSTTQTDGLMSTLLASFSLPPPQDERGASAVPPSPPTHHSGLFRSTGSEYGVPPTTSPLRERQYNSLPGSPQQPTSTAAAAGMVKNTINLIRNSLENRLDSGDDIDKNSSMDQFKSISQLLNE